MAKQLNKVEVNLEISASTEKAKQAFMDLNKSLSNLQNQNLINPDNGIRQAAQDARELQTHLSNAVNVDTGKLDLNRFSNSLKKSNKELKDYYDSLIKLGPDGEQAFLKLSRSIATAETSTIRINKKLQEFGVTLKNAARWQISSSILHRFMGAIQGAYGYAKDLDDALNDIRIVTSASVDEMDKFAVKANQAAKALSTTTTEYAKASLIYFQQGLSDSEVEQRTAVTMKMANAAGASAETISDQLTAVWNNFYDGSQSLEHFADAMVRLGADTASSSDEIATGLEKFASIGPVIGLGFDEAAAALATVTAQTRQSAEVVGTAFKTIFARIQGLNLGETLDDGTTLNKYSAALQSVGISIKDQYGGIKDMNMLLDEMGEKWNLISKDQQIALAQAVGGVRQYNQIIALMDNYDFYKQNLNAAQNAEGSLEEQAGIYAQSWEASEKRVKAAAEGIYDSLINEEFFIEFNNNLSMLLEGVEGLIDGFGGMEGVLSMVGSLALRYFAKDIPSALANTKDNMIGLLGLDSKGAKKVQEDNDKLTNSDYLDNTDPAKKVRTAQIEGTKILNTMNQHLNANLKQMSEEERIIYETKIKQVEKDYELLELQGKELETEEKTTKQLQDQIAAEAAIKKIKEQEKQEDKELRELAKKQAESEIQKPKGKNKKAYGEYEKQRNTRAEEIYQEKNKEKKISNKKKQKESTEDNKKKLNELKALVTQEEKLIAVKSKFNAQKKSLEEIKGVKELKKNTLEFVDSLKEVNKESEAYKKLKRILEDTNTTTEKAQQAFEEFENEIVNIDGKSIQDYEDIISNLKVDLEDLGMDAAKLEELEEQFRAGAISARQFEEGLDEVRDSVKDLPNHTVKTSEAIAQLTSGFMGLVGMASSIENLFDVFNDENASAIQKISAAMGGLMTAGNALTSVYKGLDSISKSTFVQKIKEASAMKASATATTADAAAKVGLAGATKTATIATNGFSTALKNIPILGWIAAAITIVTGVITALVAAEEKAIEKRAELAKESKEIADATYEEVEANRELRKSFDDALASYKEGKIEKNELIDATKELCNKYEIENAELLIAAGNYDLLAEAIRRVESEKLKAAKKDTKNAKEAAEDVFLDTMYEGKGRHSGDNYVAKLGGGATSGDEEIVKKAIDKLSQTGDISGAISHDGNDINIKTGQSVEELIKLYEDAQKVKEYILANSDAEARNESEGYQNLVSWLDKSAESYENLIALQEQLNSEEVQLQTNNITSKYGEIESQEEYLKVEAELIDKLWKSGISQDDAKELARQALMAEEAYSQWAKEAEIVEQATAAVSKNLDPSEDKEKFKEDIQKFYNDLPEEAKTLFATLNFDAASSMKDLEEQLAALQSRAEGQSIQVKIDSIKQAQSDLKSDMSLEDYRTFEESSGIDWGNEKDGVIEYTEFLTLTYEEQSDYLKKLEDDYSNYLIEVNKNTVAENKKLIENYNADLVEAQNSHLFVDNSDIGRYDTFEDRFKNLKGEMNADRQSWFNDLKTFDSDSDNYQIALNNLKGLVPSIGEDAINAYIEKFKEIETYQASINALEQENADILANDRLEALLKAKEKQEELLELSKTLADLNIGDAIDEKQFEKLGEISSELEKNFTKATDGTYRLNTELGNVYLTMSQLKTENNERIFGDLDIVKQITNLEDLREAYEKEAITQEAFNLRWSELNEAADLEGLDTEQLKDYSKHLQEIAKDSEVLSDELKNNNKSASIVAKSIMKMNKGLKSLSDGFEDWSSILKKSSKESEEYEEALDGMRDALSDVLDVSDDFVSDDFIVKQLVDIEKAANGDAEAIDRLRQALAQDIIYNIAINKGFKEEEAEEFKQQVVELQKLIPDLEVGASINTADMSEGEQQFINKCNEIISQAGMTVEEANAMFESLGFEPVFTTTTKTLTISKPIIKTVTRDYSGEVSGENENGETYSERASETYSYVSGYTPVEETYQIPAMSSDGSTPEVKTLVKKATGSFNDFSSLNPGGDSLGGSKTSSKKNTGPSKSVKPERYKEINDKLDDAANAYDKASKAADRLYGPNRLKALAENNKLLTKEINLLKQKKKEADKYLEGDRNKLIEAGKAVGFEVSINKDNLITNYTYIMNELEKQLEAAYTKAGETIEDNEQEFIDSVQEKIDNFTEAVAQFDDTREELEDIENEIQDKIYERQDLNFQKLNEELELKIEIDDRALKKLDYYADKFSDNFYKMAETYALIFKGANGEGDDKISLVKDKLSHYAGTINGDGKVVYGDYMRDLEAKYHNGDISLDQYVEGLKNAESNIIDALTELNGYDKEMLEAYGNALDAASSKIDDHVDHLEHISSVFDHYLSLMDLFGNSKDYEAMGNFLTGKAENSRNMLDIAKAELEMYREQKNEVEKEWIEAQQSGDEEAIRYWQIQWDAIVDQTDAAEEEMLSLTETWAQDMRAVIENNMAAAGEALEKSLTNGHGFDYLMDQWDRMNTRQEEYLDNVNKTYETNKLMRTAQKALDETDNKVAKQKLKGFIDETQHLQENTNLSKHELEIQQAKYDLLLAEIALEEAQNAKSTVRLSRDSEGNFGYVYTADQDKVADAQQGVDDKRNDLYNLTLEGQKEYMEKYLQASQEMYDELIALQEDYLNGIITKDEFESRKEDLEEYYLGNVKLREELSELETKWQNGEIESQEEYEKLRQGIIDQYKAEDIGIINQYLKLANIANEQANKELEELDKKYYKDGTLSEENYQKAKNTLMSTYANTNEGVIGNFLDFYNRKTGEITGEASEKWGTSLSGMTNDTSNWEKDVDRYIDEVEKNTEEWGKTEAEVNEDVGKALSNSEEATNKLKEESNELTKDLIGEDGLADAETTVIGKMELELDAVRNLTTAYGNQRVELLLLITAYEKYLETLGKKIDKESGKEDNNSNKSTTSGNSNSFNTSSSSSNGFSSPANSNQVANPVSGQQIKNLALNLLDQANLGKLPNQATLGWQKSLEQSNYNKKAIAMINKAINDSVPGFGSGWDYYKAKELLESYNPDAFDTGGFTGVWGPEGKLAFLHEKEIVLNKDDTENLLKTVSFIRELVGMIDNQASMSSLFSMSATSNVLTGNSGMEQQITIYADFPDATDHNEIEMAFNTLLNTASQYANRK